MAKDFSPFRNFANREVGFSELMAMLDYVEKLQVGIVQNSAIYNGCRLFSIVILLMLYAVFAFYIFIGFDFDARFPALLALLLRLVLAIFLAGGTWAAFSTLIWSSRALRRLRYEREQLEGFIEAIREARRSTLHYDEWTPLMYSLFNLRLSRLDISESISLK